jgi:hypothetical protein
VSANTGDSRKAEITIAGQTHTVKQEAAPCTFDISPTSRTVPSAGKSYDVAVTASHSGCDWSASEDSNWISITPTTGSDDGSVEVTVSPNTGDSRTAKIDIAGQTHTVKQDPAPGALIVTISPPEAVSAGAGWRVDEGDWKSSGDTQSGLSVGDHQLEFKPITGWTTPTSQSVTIDSNQTTDASGRYLPYLSVDTHQIGYLKFPDLTWSGASSTSVDVYRDGSIIATAPHNESYTDGPVGVGTQQATYQVCESGTSICSNEVTVSW